MIRHHQKQFGIYNGHHIFWKPKLVKDTPAQMTEGEHDKASMQHQYKLQEPQTYQINLMVLKGEWGSGYRDDLLLWRCIYKRIILGVCMQVIWGLL